VLKKIFILSLTICIILLISWGVYYISFKNSSPNDPKNTTLSENEEVESIIAKVTSAIEPIITTSVFSPVLDSNGQDILFFQHDSNLLYQFDSNLSEKKILLQNMPPNTLSAHWNKNRDEFMLQSKDGYQLYNINSTIPIPFKKNVVELTWDSLSEKVVYVYKDPETNRRSINISNPNGSNWEELLNINDTIKVKLASIPRSPHIAYWPLPNNATASTLKSVNILNSEEKTLLTEKRGADYLWSPNGKKILVSFVSDEGNTSSDITLAVMNDSGGQFQTLSNTPTLVSKCTWSKDNIHIFCAIPTEFPQSTLMPDDYINGNVFTKDTFWKINTQTGTMERVVNMKDIQESFDASDLFLSKDETLLYFVERKNENLYKVKL